MLLSLARVIRFVAVAEHLSFTRAAQMLRIDQPWLSRQIIQLEEQLGVTLFNRSGPRITLTAEGAEFYKTAKEVDEAYERVRAKAEEMKRKTMAALRIGVSNATYGMDGRTNLLKRYNSAQRNVRLEISGFAFSDEIEAKVAAGELDFGITFSRTDNPDFDMIVLQESEPSLCLPKNDPLAKKPMIMLSDLKNRRIAVGLQNAATSRYKKIYGWMDEISAVPVFVPEGRRFIFDVAEKEDLLVVSHSAVEHIPDAFVRRPMEEPNPEYQVCLLHSKRRTMSTAGERLWRIAQDMNAQFREQRAKASAHHRHVEKSETKGGSRARR